MVMSLAAGVLLMAGGAHPPADSTLAPTFRAEPAEGPAVIVRAQPAQALVAVRLSVPVEEPAAVAGAARVVQELARRRLESEAAALGARIELVRTPSHAVYSIVGPRAVFEAMVALLRRAVGPPDLAAAGLPAARLAASRAMTAELDTPEPLIRYRLRQALFPGLGEASAAGTALSAERVERFWARNFVPERMTAVVVGALSPDAALPPFRDWPRPGEPGRGTAGAVVSATPPELQVVLPWAGLGYASDADPVALAAAASLVTRHLSLLGLRSSSAELWWNGERRVLVVIGSAARTAGDSAAAVDATSLAQRLHAAVAEAATRVTAAAVAAIRRELRHEMLFAGRTPQGLTELIGTFHDRTGDARAAQRFLDGLDRVDAGDVRAAFRSLAEQPPVAVGAGS